MFFKWININVFHFLIHLLKMVSYNTYPPLPSAPPQAQGPHSVEASPQVAYHLNMVQAKRRGLINKEKMYKKKYKKYTKILNRFYVLKRLFEWNKRSHWNV